MNRLTTRHSISRALLIALCAAILIKPTLPRDAAAAPNAASGSDPDLTYLATQVADGRLDQSILNSLTATGQARGLTVLKAALAPSSVTGANGGTGANGLAAAKQHALAAAGTGAAVVRDYTKLPTQLVSFTTPAALASVLRATGGLAAVREDHRNSITLAESVPLINQPQAAAAGYTGTGYSVAVLDTGIDYLGTNFGNGAATFGNCSGGVNTGSCKVAYMQDFAPDDGQLDDNGHGTNVAGIVLGVAPGAKVLGLDVFTGGAAFDSDIFSAINFVIADRSGPNLYHVVAINLSLGLSNNYNLIQCTGSAYAAPFAGLRAAGVLPVVSAGNSAYAGGPAFQLGVSSPACAPGALSVGAVYDSAFGKYVGSCFALPGGGDLSSADRVACFSQTASYLSMLAPGAKILAAGIELSGTSQAAPHVSGAVAVLASAAPSSSASQREIALTTSGPTILDQRTPIAKHRLDVCSAVAALGIPCPATIAGLTAAINASSAASQYKLVLTNLLASAQTYVTLHTTYGSQAACSTLNVFKNLASIYSTISSTGITSATASAWNATADIIRAGIPC